MGGEAAHGGVDIGLILVAGAGVADDPEAKRCSVTGRRAGNEVIGRITAVDTPIGIRNGIIVFGVRL